MRYLTIAEVLLLHSKILQQSGGGSGLRDLAALESALAQPKMSAGGVDAYPTLVGKAVALGYSLANNHAFIDGNKRIAHASMEVFLLLNGTEIVANVDEQESTMLKVASGELSRADLEHWLEKHISYPAADTH